MSTTIGASDKQELNNEISTLDHAPGLETVSENSIQTTTGSPLSSAFGDLYNTIDVPFQTDYQRPPHRAWEEGYQSPFSRNYTHPTSSRYDNTQSRSLQYNTEPPSGTSIRRPSTSRRSAHSASPLAAANRSSTLAHSTITPHSQRDTYRPRMRRVVTKETTVEDVDIAALVTLGMSPFMAGRDIIANQNRFVRNECMFARHVVRLQRATVDSDARHARTQQNIYEHLEQHQLALNRLGDGVREASAVSNNTGTLSLGADPTFLALEKAQEETRSRLAELSQQMAESSESFQRALVDVAKRLDEVLAESRAALSSSIQ